MRFDENDDNDLNDETPTLTTSGDNLLAEITAAGVAGPVADLLTASEYSSAALTDVLVAFICRDLGVGQARYEPLDAGTYDADVVIP